MNLREDSSRHSQSINCLWGNCLITCLYYAGHILSGPLCIPPSPLNLPGTHVLFSTAAVAPGPRQCSLGQSTHHPHLLPWKFHVPLLLPSPSHRARPGPWDLFCLCHLIRLRPFTLQSQPPVLPHSLTQLLPSSGFTPTARFPAAPFQSQSSLAFLCSRSVP